MPRTHLIDHRNAWRGWIATLFIVLTQGAIFGQSPPAAPVLVPAGQGRSDRLRERNRLAWEALRMRHAGKTAEAAGAADAMLVVERQLFDNDDLDLAGAWNSRQIHEFHADFAAALAPLREAIGIRAKVSGAQDWRAIDDRYSLERIGRLAELSDAGTQAVPRGAAAF